MGRASVKENKNIYQLRREELGLTREKAGDLLQGMTAERIEKIENERSFLRPDEALIMADGYKKPSLCNYFCAEECPIGCRYVPRIREDEPLSQIVLEMLNSLNVLQMKRERLVEITVDGRIEGAEVKDFVEIQKELEKLSVTVETLQFWAEQKLADGLIDKAEYERCRKQ